MSEQMTLDLPQAASPGASVLAIGLMSGTSQDGVDVALIDTDGERIAQFGATACRPYTKAERTLLAPRHRRRGEPDRAHGAAGDRRRGGAIGQRRACRGGGELPRRQRSASRQRRRDRISRPDAAASAGARADAADRRRRRIGARVSAFRWSTIFAPPMSPPAGRARRSRRSITARWCGAWACRRRSRCSISAASPTSPISTAMTLIACDTGPGNALLDDFLRLRTGQPLDTDGRKAAAGTVDEATIARSVGSIRSSRCRRRNRSTATIFAVSSAIRSTASASRTARRRSPRSPQPRWRASCRICRARRKPGSSPAAARATRR